MQTCESYINKIRDKISETRSSTKAHYLETVAINAPQVKIRVGARVSAGCIGELQDGAGCAV